MCRLREGMSKSGAQLDVRTSPTCPLLLLPVEGVELWPGCWIVEWGMGVLLEKVEPTEPAAVLKEVDILVDKTSLLDPDKSSGLKSDDEDDGAKVAIEDPTG